MYHFRDEFSFELEAVGAQCDTALTVRHNLTGAQKMVIIPAQEFIGKDYDAVIQPYQEALLTELGFVEPPQYSPKEFAINYYRTDKGSGFSIFHTPNGKHSELVLLRDLPEPGKTQRAMRDEMMDKLIRELITDGIEPQLPFADYGIEKIGKPRWPEKQKQSRVGANVEVTHE